MDAPYKILVCGGRFFGDLASYMTFPSHPLIDQKTKEYNFIIHKLEGLSYNWPRREPDKNGNWLPNVFVIAGKASGVDTVAIDWAVLNWCDYKEYPADWKTHGKSAGPIRNRQMLLEGKPDEIVAFPGNKGTANMIAQANEAGVKCTIITYEDYREWEKLHATATSTESV